ncbi:alpha/beta hydrolase [Secundilactobacillus paracollinoides]|uniref:Alpha/beta hydrolase n=1 Tax=Secundilactobacillus paracollinoides TaxID=240427 RepID=A0A1B2IW40_9LACO|nr:alpha/beta fold hydrolase [Secundilactobacillus paracollinoides]ANZ60425.1 alpha/beta hydrolase [Secundilactobacillus paracollinoides]ANZ65291.1 alpha/beta hydrolase [Secundilactobacillus paracollinoides]ANZ66253.1 alpha/beta hydrolase [Secundilactobacillus paracollinoides]
MTEKEITVQRDNLTIRGTILTPDDTTTYDLAILMHGFTSNRGFTPDHILYNLSRKLLKQGIASLRFDFNGHGKSDGKFEDMTVPNEISDAEAILTYVRQLPEVRHIYLMGHSQGGVVASMLGGLYPEFITKIVLMAPAATLKDDALAGVLQGATYDPNHVPDKLLVRPDAGLSVGGAYLRSAQVLPIYEVAQRYHGPVTIIHGDHDVVVNIKASKRYEAVYENATLHVLKNADHSFINASRETVTNLATEAIVKQVQLNH